MRKETHKLSQRWLPCVALVSCLLLLPSLAIAQTTITDPYFVNTLLKSKLKTCSTWMGYAGQVASAVSFAEKLGQFLGLMSSPITSDQIMAEMKLIAAYQDNQQKQQVLQDAHNPIYDLDKDLQDWVAAIDSGTLNAVQLGYLQSLSTDAVSRALSPDYQCTMLTQFQTLNFGANSLQSYEWRPAMQSALTAIAYRLMALTAMNKTNNTDFRTDPNYRPELDTIRACLKQHRDTIQPPKPFAYCQLNTDCVLACQERRSWPQWTVHKSTVPFLPGCVTPSTSSVSETKFTDLEDITASKIDHDDLGSVVFSLQRMIDTLYVITHPGDLAQNDPHIRFGASPNLCLSLNGLNLILDTCSSSNGTWAYDRSTGRIKNNSRNQCISAQGYPPTAVQMVNCTQYDTDESQVWSWNPETGIIKNSFGSVLAITDGTPKATSSVSAQPENAWHLNQQVWTSKVSTICTGAICPAIGPAAWNQGTITTGSGSGSTTLRYPVDFNIFAYEQASSFQDVGGPVAAAGSVNTRSFRINYQNAQTLPVALVVGYGPVQLQDGSIYGTPFIPPYITSGQSLPGSVTVHGPPGYVAPINENPINFEMAFLNLQAWSTSLASLSSPSAAASFVGDPRAGTLWLRTTSQSGGNPNLEIFNIKATDVVATKTFLFQTSCPTILINVTGSTAIFISSSVTGLRAGQNILWNFPQASTLEMSSLGFFGSVLAPFAYVNVHWGWVSGTMVAWSALAGMEFYSNPLTNYQVVKGR